MNRPSAAFFDLDRTLIRGSSVYAFGYAAWRHGMVPTRDILDDARKAAKFRLTGESGDRVSAVRDRVLGAIAGHSQAELTALGDDIIPKLLGHLRDESQGFIDLHHEAGRDTYIVTASPFEIASELADQLGMTGAIATVAEVVDGRYSGRLAAPFCYGEGKAQAIEKLAAARGYDLEVSYAYSDSLSDLPMMEAVGHPVAVNPDRALEQIARTRGWPIVEFSRTAKRVVRLTTAGVGAAGLATATYFLGRSHGATRRR